MLRPTEPADTPALLDLAAGTGVFKPSELVALGEVLDDYHVKDHALGHRCVSAVVDGEVVGFAYDAPSSLADRAWYLYWIAVSKGRQSRGHGAELLRAAEAIASAAGARIFFIETSSLPHYEPTRRFYLAHGYGESAVVPDFYADGDHLVVFSKRFLPPAPPPPVSP